MHTVRKRASELLLQPPVGVVLTGPPDPPSAQLSSRGADPELYPQVSLLSGFGLGVAYARLGRSGKEELRLGYGSCGVDGG